MRCWRPQLGRGSAKETNVANGTVCTRRHQDSAELPHGSASPTPQRTRRCGSVVSDHAAGIELGQGAGVIEAVEFRLRQIDVGGLQVFFELFHRAHAENDAGDEVLRAEPGQRDLRLGGAALLGDGVDGFQNAPVALRIASMPRLLRLRVGRGNMAL